MNIDASHGVVQGKPDVLRKQLGLEAEAEGILRQLVWWVPYQRENLSEVGSIDVRDNQDYSWRHPKSDHVQEIGLNWEIQGTGGVEREISA